MALQGPCVSWGFDNSSAPALVGLQPADQLFCSSEGGSSTCHLLLSSVLCGPMSRIGPCPALSFL
jgi:hypothetical protein